MFQDPKWNGRDGRGGITWDERSRMGLLRGVIDAGDAEGKRNKYLHRLHCYALVEALRRRKPFRRSLDFGCGTGRFLSLLAEVSEHVYGVDRSAAMVEAARLHNASLASSIVSCSEGTLPFSDGAFDCALSFSVLSAIAADQVDPCIAELARVCAPGATLLLCEKVRRSIGMTPAFYRAKLAKAGFTMLQDYPIRAATCKLSRCATKPWMRGPMVGALAAFEYYLTAFGFIRLPRDSYADYFFVCERGGF